MKHSVVAACVTLFGLAACAGHPAPSSAPTPAPAPAVAVVPSDDTVPHDTARAPAVPPRPAPVRRDSANVSETDVTRQAVQVFGDTVAADSAVAADSGETGPTWDMDVRSYETQARVAHFVDVFTGPSRDYIESRLSRGSRYEPMIRAKFKAGGLPEDMSYLALVESGYDPNAYSRAAAVGMWQFMASTGRDLGLRVDWWVDERRDPAKSTDAAIRFIRYLREQFGSLYLAAAAYNGGPGRISRGLSRFADDMGDVSGEDRFFALAEEDYLPRETKDYVPQLIAVALVAKDPVRYGLQVEQRPAFAYDSIDASASTPLAAIAKASGASVAELKDLNPHVLRGVTPPTGRFWVRIPSGRAAGFDSAFAALDSTQRRAFTRVVSKKGQSLGSIAVKHDLTARELGWYNPKVATLKPSGRLRPGQVILVPSRAVVAAATDVPDPTIERYGGSSGRLVTHVVRRGESLGSIAKKYHTSVAELKRLNGLRKTMIFPGQSIVVKGSARRASSSRSHASSRSRARKGSAKTKVSARSGKGRKSAN